MDDNRILTNKIFKQKINELVGADVVELEAANDDLALNCKVFETGMDAIKLIIPDPTPTPTPTSNVFDFLTISYDESTMIYSCPKTYAQLIEEIDNGVMPVFIFNNIYHYIYKVYHGEGIQGLIQLIGFDVYYGVDEVRMAAPTFSINGNNEIVKSDWNWQVIM